jgi:hypothetical protein
MQVVVMVPTATDLYRSCHLDIGGNAVRQPQSAANEIARCRTPQDNSSQTMFARGVGRPRGRPRVCCAGSHAIAGRVWSFVLGRRLPALSRPRLTMQPTVRIAAYSHTRSERTGSWFAP